MMANPFSRGDEVEVANRAFAQLLQGGALGYHTGKLLQYGLAGLWTPLTPEYLTMLVAGYAGMPVVTNQTPTLLRLTAAKVKGIIHLLEQRVKFTSSTYAFSTPPPGASFRNGFAFVSGGTIRLVPHDPSQVAQYQYPFDYDPNAARPYFDWFLSGVFADADYEDRGQRIELLQDFSGTCLIGQATRYQKALVLHGSGGNGKSTLEEILRGAFPHGSTVTLAPQDMSGRFRAACLGGKLINLVNELPESKLLNQDVFKSVISGETIMVEHKNKDPFELTPIAGHVFSTNTLPSTGDHSYGFYRRFEIVPFTQDMTRSPYHTKDLASHILTTELPGVVAWLLEGAARTQRSRGYTFCKASQSQKDLWRNSTDHIKAFAEEHYTVDEASFSSSQSMYDHFRLWADKNGVRRVSKLRFCRRLRELGFSGVHRGHGNGFRVRQMGY